MSIATNLENTYRAVLESYKDKNSGMLNITEIIFEVLLPKIEQVKKIEPIAILQMCKDLAEQKDKYFIESIMFDDMDHVWSNILLINNWVERLNGIESDEYKLCAMVHDKMLEIHELLNNN